ncbi:MFS transporter [Paucibacter sp. KCTC 42545]|uniref:MFS transporter n=1 Tax=Paucibacter sp. KCTC 42545 TaxID=1768242 RepID=UPI0018D2173C|nr:MFS transporter [Paucibacter sp. KCTC 42545]
MTPNSTAGHGTATSAFRQFWAADIALRLGGRAWMLALPVIAIEFLQADSRQIGYLATASTASYLILGLPAGAWVERMRKRNVMLSTAVIRALLLCSIPLLWWLGGLSFSFLLAVTFMIGLANLFYDTAYQSYIPLLVGANNTYKANAQIETTARAARAVTPALLGWAMKTISAPLLLLIDAFGHVVSATLLRRVPEVEEKLPAPSSRNLRAELMEGFRFIRNEPVLWSIALAIVFSNFFATAITTLMPVLVLTHLKLGPGSLGVVYTAGEIGGFLGALLLTPLRRYFEVGQMLAGGLLLAAGSTALVPLAMGMPDSSPKLALGILMLSVFGTAIGGVTFAVSQISLRQMLCPAALSSRVNATMRFVIWGTMPAASLLAGAGAYWLGTIPTLWLAVVGTVLTVLPILSCARYSTPQSNGRALGDG